jgi:hypothetical protein
MYGDPKTSGKDLYAELRLKGRVLLSYDNVGGIATAKRLAKADGFVVTTSRGSRGTGDFRMTDDQARTRPTEVALTQDGMHIVAPDAQEA